MGRKARRTATRDNGGQAVPGERRTVPAPSNPRDAATWLFAATLFLSATLLFVIQPMFAKMVLPLLGGAPAVWNTCLVFYQAVLLTGYLYAHWSLKRLGPRRQAGVHLALLAAALLMLPIGVARGWLPPPSAFPVFWLWMLLCVSLGAPLALVSATAPMLQAWFAATRSPSARDPYFLYAASNLGSMLALAAYPLWFESSFALRGQSMGWTAGYVLLIVLIAACAVRLWRALPEAADTKVSYDAAAPAPIATRRRLLWLALSFVPSCMLLAVTTLISNDLLAMPMLWVVPLALYLLTFVLVFARRAIVPLRWIVRAQPFAAVVGAAALVLSTPRLHEILLLGSLHLVVFFISAMVCHGRLAADRPESSRLTEFYLWMSLGGVLGGLFGALAAPLLFRGVFEYPLMLAGACLLRPPAENVTPLRKAILPACALLFCMLITVGVNYPQFLPAMKYADDPVMRCAAIVLAAIATLMLSRRPAVFAAGVAVLATISLWMLDPGNRVLLKRRSFYGIVVVEENTIWNRHELKHGSTCHGQQSFDASRRNEPEGYYHRTGPLGTIFASLAPRRPLREIGVLGLGAGGIATYGQPGERITFYEIDPVVSQIAQDPRYFTCLSDCLAKTDIVLGDARLMLAHGPPRTFDLLIVDVFNSDVVPVHLLTREALALYFEHLAPHGILAMHISSRYLDLEPIVGQLAADGGYTARICRDLQTARISSKNPSVWVVMAAKRSDLGPLADDTRWIELRRHTGPLWTDEFSNPIAALRWKSDRLQLLPFAWLPSNTAREHFLRGVALLEDKRADDAIEHFRQSVAIDPTSADAEFSLAAALAFVGKHEESIEHYAASLRLDPTNAIVHYNLGVALSRLGYDDKAFEQFDEAVRLRPDYVEALGNLGMAYAARNQFVKAIECYEKVLVLQPNHAQTRYNYGVVLAAKGDAAAADRALREALRQATEQKNTALVKTIEAALKRAK